jgi:hypothetical protein
MAKTCIARQVAKTYDINLTHFRDGVVTVPFKGNVWYVYPKEQKQ